MGKKHRQHSKSRSKKKNRDRSQRSLSGVSVSMAGKMPPGASVAALSVGPGAGGPGVVRFGDKPQIAACPQCAILVQTVVTYTPGLCTYALCIVTVPCCWIPFTLDCSKDIEHRCPTCGFYFGKCQRLTAA